MHTKKDKRKADTKTVKAESYKQPDSWKDSSSAREGNNPRIKKKLCAPWYSVVITPQWDVPLSCFHLLWLERCGKLFSLCHHILRLKWEETHVNISRLHSRKSTGANNKKMNDGWLQIRRPAFPFAGSLLLWGRSHPSCHQEHLGFSCYIKCLL